MEITRRSLVTSALAALGASTLRSAPTLAQSAALKEGLLAFENAVSWQAVSRAWLVQRPQWLAAVRDANSPQGVAAQVLRLETSMGWSSVQDSWRQRRAGWVQQLGAVTNDHDVAARLLELEGVTRWSAVSESWRAARGPWVQRMSAI